MTNVQRVNMKCALVRHKAHIERLLKLNVKDRKRWLKLHCSNDLLNCFSEIAKNILSDKIKLSPKQKKLFNRNRKQLRALASKKICASKKFAIVQRGGFLAALLAPLLGGLGSWLFNKVTGQ